MSERVRVTDGAFAVTFKLYRGASGGAPDGSSQFQLIQISNNDFLEGGQAIRYNGSHRTVVRGKVVRDTTLGVSAGGNLQLGDNFSF